MLLVIENGHTSSDPLSLICMNYDAGGTPPNEQ